MTTIHRSSQATLYDVPAEADPAERDNSSSAGYSKSDYESGSLASFQLDERCIEAPKPTCSIPGCSKRAKARGWCAAHHERWRKYGDPLQVQPRAGRRRHRTTDALDRRPPWPVDGRCIEWDGGRSPEGYGYILWDGKRNQKVHRVVYEAMTGESPEVVMHTCDNPPCYRFEHLVGGTHIENQADKVAKGREAKGEGNGRAKLPMLDVAAIRSSEEPTARLARQYGVDHTSIRKARMGLLWRSSRTPPADPEVLAKARRAGEVARVLARTALTCDQVAEIRTSSERLSVLAEKYGVHRTVVGRIRRRASYRHCGC